MVAVLAAVATAAPMGELPSSYLPPPPSPPPETYLPPTTPSPEYLPPTTPEPEYLPPPRNEYIPPPVGDDVTPSDGDQTDAEVEKVRDICADYGVRCSVYLTNIFT